MANDVQRKIIDANDQNIGSVIQSPKACGIDAHSSNYVISDKIQRDMTDIVAFNKYNTEFTI